MTANKGGLRRKPGYPFKLDPQGFKIDGGVEIRDILNQSVASGTWTEIQVPASQAGDGYGMACKAIYAKLRDNSTWYLSHMAAGTRYITIVRGISINIGAIAGDTLFYAQCSNPAGGTLEVMLLD